MTLEELTSLLTEACKKAHLFTVNSIGSSTPIRSVAMRIDEDGVLSILLYETRMANRVLSDEAKHVANALKLMKLATAQAPDLKIDVDEFDGFFVHWNVIAEALSNAGPEYQEYVETPLELVERLIGERDGLRKQVANLEKEKSKLPPFPQELPAAAESKTHRSK